MLLVQTLMTLMAGLFCRPAGAPLADLAVRAFSSVDPPMVMRIGDEKESKTIVVRTKRCTDDKKADRKKADTCENTRCVVMKRDRAEKGKSACCSETRRVITKRSCLGEEACPDDAAKCIVVMARVGADGCGGDLKSAPKGMKKFCLSLADDGPQPREGMKKFCIRLDSDDPLGSGDEDEEGVWEINVKEASAPAGGPWLGVQFGPVSKPLASQLGLQKGIGEMVLNVIEGSPADKAGLQQYDVIVRIDDQAASTDIAEFLGMVQKYAPGEVHKLSLIRGGRPVETTVTVGARPEEVGSAKYKYDMELEELAQNDVLQRGGILRKGPGGGWAFQGLGNLKNMPKMWQDLPDEESIRNLLDLYGGKPGSECQLVLIRKDKDKSLEIRRDGDKITVTRTKIADDGNKTYTTKTYTGEEELKKEDQEAFEMMKECAPEGVGGKKGTRVLITPGGDHLKIVPKDLGKDLKELQENAEEMRKDAAKAQKEAQKAVQEGMRQYEAARGEFFAQSKARTSFDVSSDGKIRVTTRKGGEELTQTFDNAEALKKANPDLYAKYQKLREGSGKAEPRE